MDVFEYVLLSGVAYATVLFLVATGLSLVMGLMGIVNLAHGVLFMTGAYAGVLVAKTTDNIFLGILTGGILAALLGLLIERGFLRLLYKRELQQILVTFGIVYIVTNVHLWIYGGWPKSGYIPNILTGTFAIGKFQFDFYRVFLIIIGVLICLILWWLQEKTRIGAIIRAGMDDAEMTRGMGINLTPINIGAFCVAALLAGCAGVLGSPVLGGINLSTGTEIFFLSIGVCIVGGVGSIQGTMVGALLIGIGTIMASTYLPAISIYVMYILMVLVLIFKPSGLITRG